MPTQFIEEELPRNISEGSKGGPGFNTTIFTAISGAEQRNINWQDQRCQYDIAYGIQDRADMDSVIAFFYNVKGKAIGFRFYDWTDHSITNGNIGTGDGLTTVFQLVKKYTVGSSTFTREIKKPISGTLSGVTVNAVPKVEGVDFTVDYNTGLITFSVAPGNTFAVVVGSCEFNVPVRFDVDQLPITSEAWEIESTDTGILLVEIKL